MLCLDNTDVLEAWSDTDAVIDCSIHGLVSGVFTNLYTGTLGNVANVVVYTAGVAISVVSVTFVNTGGAAATVNFKLDPADGGNDKFLLPVAVSLEAGNSLVFDGQRFSVMDTSGQVLNTFPLPLSVANGGTGLTSYAVGDLIYASGATVLSKLADVAVGQVLVSGGVGVAPAWSATPTLTSLSLTTGELTAGSINRAAGTMTLEIGGVAQLSMTNVLAHFTNKVGIGTTTIPHGGIGVAKFAIEGTDSNAAGPHVQFTTSINDYPLMGIFPWAHDSIAIFFDSYYDGAYKSSDAGSSFALMKGLSLAGDTFGIMYDVAAEGAAITWNDGIVLNTSGIVSMPAVYAHDMNGETYRNLLINDSGELGVDLTP